MKNLLKKLKMVVQTAKPRLLFKLLKIKAAEKLTGRLPAFRQVEIQITFACNLRCRHCSTTSFDLSKNHLTIDDYRRIARQCRQNNVAMVSFTGGEPLYDPRIEKIIGVFDTGATLVSITTNGTLLTPELAQRLKRLGVDNLTISLDGDTPETNDAIRGQGTFHKILKAIDIALTNRLSVIVIYTLSHKSISDGIFDRMIHFCAERGLTLHVSLAAPVGNWCDPKAAAEYVLTPKDIAYLTKCQARYPFLRRDLDGNFTKRGCPAGTERFVISPFGDVLCCTKIQACFGNVKESSMLDLARKMKEYEFIRSSPPVCLVAEDKNFLDTYLPRLAKNTKLPVSAQEYFNER